jgi:hypothetical protein
MRQHCAWIAFAVLVVVVACRSSAPPVQEPIANAAMPPIEVAIELDRKMAEQLAYGLPMHLELVMKTTAVGSCTLAFDIWDENYRVTHSRRDVETFADSDAALRACVDMQKLEANRRGQRKATLVVRAVEPKRPLYEHPAPAPVF